MRKVFVFIYLAVFSICNLQNAPANSAPVDSSAVYYLEEKSPKEVSKHTKDKYASNIEIVEKDSKGEEKRIGWFFFKDDKEESKFDKDENKDCKESLNIVVDDSQIDKVLSSSAMRISAIYPNDIEKATNSFPGYRGTNQLVVYRPDFGRTTGTNEFGKEALVENGVVTKLTGANSTIPKNGFVISGHGRAKKWISDNLKIGTKIEIENNTLKALTTVESYRYYAKHRIDEVEDIMISTKSDYLMRDDKNIYLYLKKAKQQYKKSLKDYTEESLECAKEAIKSATLAYRYTLPFLTNELKGVWIRPTQKNLVEVQQALDEIKSTGIDNVFLETYYHGRTIFPSRIMQDYGFEKLNPEFNYDVLGAWVREAHKRGIKVHVWFQSFYIGNKSPLNNPKSILAVKPEWSNRPKQKADEDGYVSHPQEHNGYFLDPANPEVITFLLKLINEISSRYSVDGFNIDYVRYPNVSKENFSNQWGYTKFAREEFKKIYEIDPVEISQRGGMWTNWCDYRKDKITNYVLKVSSLLRSKKIMFSTVIFPDYKVSVQTKYQDWAYWTQKKYVDAITPLILTSDDNLAYDMLDEIKKRTDSDILIYPGLFGGFIESDPEDLLRQIHIIRKLRLQGVVLFDWAHLNANYLEVLKTSVFKTPNF